jgi:CheY-like chemotaxis protein
VDDDRVSATILCSMLRAAGAEAEAIGNAEEALERLSRTRFDLLLCDVYMPGVDGFELVRRMRQLAAPAGTTPSIAITAHPSFENRRDAQRAGFQDLISKPVEPAELVQAVQGLLRR